MSNTSLIKETEVLLNIVALGEPEQCIRRLICDLSTGQLPESEDNVMLKLFNEEVPPTSAKFEFVQAAKLGKFSKAIEKCELTYSCPISGAQMEKFIASIKFSHYRRTILL